MTILLMHVRLLLCDMELCHVGVSLFERGSLLGIIQEIVHQQSLIIHEGMRLLGHTTLRVDMPTVLAFFVRMRIPPKVYLMVMVILVLILFNQLMMRNLIGALSGMW